MHADNVLSAWIMESHDDLRAAADRTGVGFRELSALTLLAGHENCSLEWLRPRVGLTQSGTVRLMDRLEALGLAVRGPASARTSRLSITPRGLEVLRAWHRERAAVFAHAIGGLREDQREQLAALLATALRNRHRTRPQADTACRTCNWPTCGTDCPVDHSAGAKAGER
jgi:DNA-binding MarR family transcriptional regulator